MTLVPIDDLAVNPKNLLRRLKAEGLVVLAFRGKPTAILVPLDRSATSKCVIDALARSALARIRNRPALGADRVQALVRKTRAGRRESIDQRTP